MAKKKNKKSLKTNQRKKATQHHEHSEQPKIISTTKDLVVVQLSKADVKTETTFSKKLEEVISENETVTKKGLFGGRIILLGPPAGYTKDEWRAHLNKIFKTTLKGLTVILLVGVVSSAIVVIELISDHRVMPRVAFAGEDLGYLKLEDAKAKIASQLDAFSATPLTFNFKDKSVNLTLADLGISYQIDQSFAQIPQYNFHYNSVFSLIRAQLSDQNIPAVYQVDPQKAYNVVSTKLGIDDLRAKNAQFYLDDKKKLQISEQREGVMIDQASFNQQLAALLSSQSTHTITLPIIAEYPTVSTTDLQNNLSDLSVKLDNEISLKYNSKTWKFKPKNHLEAITFNKLNQQIVIKLSPKIIPDFFQKEVFDSFELPVGDLKITQNANGKINFDGQAKNGLQVKENQFITDLELALNNFDHDIDIQTEEIKSKIEISPELQAMGIKELIGTGHTAFANSHNNRIHNINVGMAKFNGVIIKPDETFSFDDNLGPVDGSTGYKLELVIKAEGTVPDFGGGLCQVSSTMFKAALFSGLPIVERAPHSYAVGYYAQVDGYGLDATIYPGVRDLKFTNNTGHPILVQSFTDGVQAYMNFFGTSDGRTARLENYWRGNYRAAGGTQLIPTTTIPAGTKQQIESAVGGFDASWDRIITDKEGKETREKIYSVYRPTANRILVGQ